MPTLKSIEDLNQFFLSLRHGMFKSGVKEETLHHITSKLRHDYNTDPVLFGECIAQHRGWVLSKKSNGNILVIEAPTGCLRVALYPDPVFLPTPLQPWYHRALGLFR